MSCRFDVRNMQRHLWRRQTHAVLRQRASVKNCTKLPIRKVQRIACHLSHSKHQTKQVWVRSTNSLHDTDKGMGKTAQRFTQKYEGCPESIQPFWISREPVMWPWSNLAANQRRPYCASVNSHSPVGLGSWQWEAVDWACVLWERRIGFIIRIYHDARSHERQICALLFGKRNMSVNW